MSSASDILASVATPGRSRSGRPEFGRVYLRSLIASAEEQVDLHRTGGHRLRLWLPPPPRPSFVPPAPPPPQAPRVREHAAQPSRQRGGRSAAPRTRGRDGRLARLD